MEAQGPWTSQIDADHRNRCKTDQGDHWTIAQDTIANGLKRAWQWKIGETLCSRQIALVTLTLNIREEARWMEKQQTEKSKGHTDTDHRIKKPNSGKSVTHYVQEGSP